MEKTERKRNFRFETLQLHAGHTLDIITTRAKSCPIYVTTSLAEYVANVFGGTKMAALEVEINVISTSSGRTVQFVAISTICSVGDNIISTSCLYAIYLESMRNPKFNIPDFEAICKIAHDAGITVIAKSEYFTKPIEHGADIVVHSATKWIGGHGTTIGGVVIDEVRSKIMRNIGPCQNPFGSFLLIQVLKTLLLRMISYGFHWIWMYLAFGVKGDANVGAAFTDALQLANAKTLVIHPASTTHQQLTDEEQISAGVNKEMIRVSVGYEHIDDIKEDFTIAFEKIKEIN
ncbi:PLP-dependent transferase [Rhizophagus irregularis]|uniref:PLP-dependent transferase n=1 Tax=Rhizophagus irregularis TaxID=588596 RepID=A0A2I1HMW5_9GLOM|nr:PLP-dependent transferase [Rhizophagus irregularis]